MIFCFVQNFILFYCINFCQYNKIQIVLKIHSSLICLWAKRTKYKLKNIVSRQIWLLAKNVECNIFHFVDILNVQSTEMLFQFLKSRMWMYFVLLLKLKNMYYYIFFFFKLCDNLLFLVKYSSVNKFFKWYSSCFITGWL